ncbi:MAG: PA2169 family four-helix-bundle protein [Bacteroidales bacterium]|nr:PA2169 family four-helix-bundle protein [Bacteroidales bacterium]
MNIDNKQPNNTPIEEYRLYSLEEKEKIVEVLNSLVQINNDRIEGYGQAAESTDDIDLKVLFNRMISKSQSLKIPLIKEVRKYGGEPTEATTTLGKVFRVWMDFKATLSGKDRKAILKSCEYGESAAQDTYTDAINENEYLPFSIIEMVTDQKVQLNDDLNYVKSLIEKQ